MAELRVSDTEIFLKKPVVVRGTIQPFWKKISFEDIVGGIRLDTQTKIYTTIILKRKSVVSVEIIEATHTIRFYMEGSHTHEIQFEDEDSCKNGLYQLRNFFG